MNDKKIVGSINVSPELKKVYCLKYCFNNLFLKNFWKISKFHKKIKNFWSFFFGFFDIFLEHFRKFKQLSRKNQEKNF